MKKKLITVTAALMAAVQIFTATAYADSFSDAAQSAAAEEAFAAVDDVPLKASSVAFTSENSLPEGELNNEEAEERFLENLMYEDTSVNNSINLRGASYGKGSLTSKQKKLYDAFLPELKKAALGKRSNAIFTLKVSGYSSFYTLNADFKAALIAAGRDYPEYLYWFASRWSTSANYALTSFSAKLVVSKPYAASNDSYKLNKTKITKAQTALNNAKKFAKKCASLPDYKKVYAFCDEICRLNVYDTSAVDKYNANSQYPTTNCNPWNIISVFDNDPKTNVVCEGYSKCMQYLCELSGIKCYIATSYSHMWNIVVLDGKSYHVDVTFADTGTGDNLSLVKKYHPFVLKGASSSTASYVNVPFKVPGYVTQTTSYYYDTDTTSMLSAKIRKVSTKDYKPVTVQAVKNFKAVSSPRSVKLTWSKNSTADKYRIFYSSNNGKTWKTVATTKNNKVLSYTVKDLKNLTKYTFRIQALKGSNKSKYTTVNATTKLSAVAGLKAKAGKTNVQLSWKRNTSASKYVIYCSANGGKSWKKLATTKNNSVVSYNAKKLKANTNYVFRIQSVKGNYKSGYSQVKTAKK